MDRCAVVVVAEVDVVAFALDHRSEALELAARRRVAELRRLHLGRRSRADAPLPLLGAAAEEEGDDFAVARADRVVERRAAPAVDGRRVGAGLVDEERHGLEVALRRGEVDRRPPIIVHLVDRRARAEELAQGGTVAARRRVAEQRRPAALAVRRVVGRVIVPDEARLELRELVALGGDARARRPLLVIHAHLARRPRRRERPQRRVNLLSVERIPVERRAPRRRRPEERVRLQLGEPRLAARDPRRLAHGEEAAQQARRLLRHPRRQRLQVRPLAIRVDERAEGAVAVRDDDLVAEQHLGEQGAEPPPVDREAVAVFQEELRRQKLGRPHDRVQRARRRRRRRGRGRGGPEERRARGRGRRRRRAAAEEGGGGCSTRWRGRGGAKEPARRGSGRGGGGAEEAAAARRWSGASTEGEGHRWKFARRATRVATNSAPWISRRSSRAHAAGRRSTGSLRSSSPRRSSAPAATP